MTQHVYSVIVYTGRTWSTHAYFDTMEQASHFALKQKNLLSKDRVVISKSVAEVLPVSNPEFVVTDI